jgi:hypothetical protein
VGERGRGSEAKKKTKTARNVGKDTSEAKPHRAAPKKMEKVRVRVGVRAPPQTTPRVYVASYRHGVRLSCAACRPIRDDCLCNALWSAIQLPCTTPITSPILCTPTP